MKEDFNIMSKRLKLVYSIQVGKWYQTFSNHWYTMILVIDKFL